MRGRRRNRHDLVFDLDLDLRNHAAAPAEASADGGASSRSLAVASASPGAEAQHTAVLVDGGLQVGVALGFPGRGEQQRGGLRSLAFRLADLRHLGQHAAVRRRRLEDRRGMNGGPAVLLCRDRRVDRRQDGRKRGIDVALGQPNA